MHQIDCTVHSTSPICCLGWGVNLTDTSIARTHVRRIQQDYIPEELLSNPTGVGAVDAMPDLPKDLMFLDVEAVLPLPSPLEPRGKE